MLVLYYFILFSVLIGTGVWFVSTKHLIPRFKAWEQKKVDAAIERRHRRYESREGIKENTKVRFPPMPKMPKMPNNFTQTTTTTKKTTRPAAPRSQVPKRPTAPPKPPKTFSVKNAPFSITPQMEHLATEANVKDVRVSFPVNVKIAGTLDAPNFRLDWTDNNNKTFFAFLPVPLKNDNSMLLENNVDEGKMYNQILQFIVDSKGKVAEAPPTK